MHPCLLARPRRRRPVVCFSRSRRRGGTEPVLAHRPLAGRPAAACCKAPSCLVVVLLC
jgi:hypothetical protein